jgi:tripartite-type tricarboxylate transporter receptor subunit TctC
MAMTARKFLAFAFAVLAAGAAQAKYPDKSVRIVVPFAAGGVADITARIMGKNSATGSASASMSRTSRAPAASPRRGR